MPHNPFHKKLGNSARDQFPGKSFHIRFGNFVPYIFSLIVDPFSKIRMHSKQTGIKYMHKFFLIGCNKETTTESKALEGFEDITNLAWQTQPWC